MYICMIVYNYYRKYSIMQGNVIHVVLFYVMMASHNPWYDYVSVNKSISYRRQFNLARTKEIFIFYLI